MHSTLVIDNIIPNAAVLCVLINLRMSSCKFPPFGQCSKACMYHKHLCIYGTVQLQLHIIMHYHVCQCMASRKELQCVMLCGCMSHVPVQHGYAYPLLAINSTHKAQVVAVSQVV